ncbi:MAG: hypothetical protein OXH08_01690 [Gammaproteobacteria bacterium]|nr:hypothetical protein [Gammaproteobacteria bacterium]MDE0649089.1 hypothetical protein [Gammaproteobacteria bacterium]
METMTADPQVYMATAGANTSLVIFATILLENLPRRSCLKARVVAENVLKAIEEWSDDLGDLPFGASYSEGAHEQMTKIIELCKKSLADKAGTFDLWTDITSADIKIPDWVETDQKDFSRWLATHER